jgi:ubiquinone/menaquinone biosynthesis C-methylase UbiE
MKTKPARGTNFQRVLSDWIGQNFTDAFKVLDIGGGSGLFWAEILQRYPSLKLTIVDPFEIGLLQDYSHERIQRLWQEELPSISDESYDIVTAIDLLEHLPKHEARLLLYQAQRVSRGAVVAYTPNGFLWQPPSVNNAFNAHISGWSFGDLKEFGFRFVRGHVGWKRLFGPYSMRKEKLFLFPFTVPMMALSYILATRLPRSAYAFSAWLDRKDTIPAIDQTR